MPRFAIISTRKEIDLSVAHWFPPIPTRNYDFSAIDANTYDADWDGEKYVSDCPQGFGPTEADAVNDLIDQLEEE